MAREGFGNNKPSAILERLKRFYGTPIIQELDQALLCLHNPIERNQQFEVILCNTEEVKIFLMAHSYGYNELSNVNLISYVMIKLSRCGRLYTKAI